MQPLLRATVLWATLLLSGSAALAFDPAYPFTDPLLTSPDVLTTGATLPGDQAPVSCPVDKDFSQPLTLAEAVDLALCNNPQARASWATIKIQAGLVGETRAAYLPVVSGNVSHTYDQIDYSDSRYPSSNVDRNTAQATMSLRLLDFGGRSANHQAAEAMLTAALAGHNATLQRVLAEVVQSYCDALATRAGVSAKQKGVEIAAQTLRSAQARETKGAGAQTDTLQATTALAKATLESNRAQGEYAKALALLQFIAGIPGTVSLSLPEDGREQVSEDQGKLLQAWLEEAQRQHPALVSARSQLAAAQHKVEAVRSAGLPYLGLTTSYYRNTRPGDAVTATEAQETTIGLTVSVPLFDGFSSTYKLQGARAQVEQKEAQLAETEHQIAMDVIKAHADATSTLNNLQASMRLLDTALQALTVTSRKYDKGAADIVEMLTTQAALAEARQERIRCLAEWRSARLRLFASAGKLGRAVVGE
jgi:outer membrane protein